MPRSRTTDRRPRNAGRVSSGSEPSPIDAGPHEYDDVLGVYTLFVVMPREETVYFRLVVELWEDYAVARTMERFYGPDRRESLAVVLAVPDYLGPCTRSLARLTAEIDGRQVPSTPELREALRRDLLETEGAG